MAIDRGIEPLVRAEAVARELAVAPRTVFVMAARGEIPCVRIGRAVRFDPRAIRRFIERGGTVKAGSR
jgi:excisionase family DNA binding protein